MKDLDTILRNSFPNDSYFFIAIHSWVENNSMSCPIRSGKGRIEYNSKLWEQLSDSQVSNLINTEIIRITQGTYMDWHLSSDQSLYKTVSDILLSPNSSKFTFPSSLKLQEGQEASYYLNELARLKDSGMWSPDKSDAEYTALWGSMPFFDKVENILCKRDTTYFETADTNGWSGSTILDAKTVLNSLEDCKSSISRYSTQQKCVLLLDVFNYADNLLMASNCQEADKVNTVSFFNWFTSSFSDNSMAFLVCLVQCGHFTNILTTLLSKNGSEIYPRLMSFIRNH